jgi:hypothetical protein
MSWADILREALSARETPKVSRYTPRKTSKTNSAGFAGALPSAFRKICPQLTKMETRLP